MKKLFIFLVLFTLFTSCSKDTEKIATASKTETIDAFLPFILIELNSASIFKDVPDNWKIVGSVHADPNKEKTLITTEGTGILVNLPSEESKGHLFTDFEHGDMELDVDIMMPKGSNSGLYFQGRYEVQLLDSWGIENPQHSDMGGIYHRWNDERGKGNEGFDGSAPIMNAAKAPGLWQHFKIIFHAPKFDSSGKKTKNAEFEEVRLNGVLVQKNVILTGPTRASAFEDEQLQGPLMIQGDHGPVALKQIKYKLYDTDKVILGDMTMKEFESDSVMIGNLEDKEPQREIKTDTISAAMASGKNPQKILSYTGQMLIPESGNYLFDYRIQKGGGQLIIDNEVIVDLDGDYTLDSLGVGVKKLEAGNVPFQLIYNKHRYWKQGFSLYVEGPGLQKHALSAASSLGRNTFLPEDIILIPITDEVAIQRSFWMHKGEKRTHCISVGTPQGIHYAYDLSAGALLQVWNGDFFDGTEMWLNRGEKQLGLPSGFTVSFHGDPEFITTADMDKTLPQDASNSNVFKSTGFVLDKNGIPTFNYKFENTTISDKLVPSDNTRSLNRTITSDGTATSSHKIAEGKQIDQLLDGRFMVNDESYFIDFPKDALIKPEVRDSEGKQELIVNIPAGAHILNYEIIW